MPKQGVDKNNTHFKTQKFFFYSTVMICGTYMPFIKKSGFLTLLKNVIFISTANTQGFSNCCSARFITTMTYDDWVNENLREIKYFEE
jgi:hypothetical protein